MWPKDWVWLAEVVIMMLVPWCLVFALEDERVKQQKKQS
jgi:hypothetical protein